MSRLFLLLGRWTVGLWLVALGYASYGTEHAQGKATALKVISFNLLSPVWSSREYFEGIDYSLVDRKRRYARIAHFITTHEDADLMAFQEMTAREYNQLRELLSERGSDFEFYVAFMDPKLWGDQAKEMPYEENGVAMFVNRRSLSNVAGHQIEMPDGNRALVVTAKHTQSGQDLRLATIHLDSELEANRNQELQELFAQVPYSPVTVDVILGDFNQYHIADCINALTGGRNFSNVLCDLGLDQNILGTYSDLGEFCEKCKHDGCFMNVDSLCTGCKKKHEWFIDHVFIRNAKAESGRVYLDIHHRSITDTLSQCLDTYGSDHVPIEASLCF